MSLHLSFEPHSWYMGFAIGKYAEATPEVKLGIPYFAVIDNGNTYQVDQVEGTALADIKRAIRIYHLTRHTGVGERIAKSNIEYLRQELEAERISTQELIDLAYYAEMGYIDADDVQLLEAAGVPEVTR